MDNEQIVALLRRDMEGEHQAIVQYLNHAYTMGREDLAPSIEAVAREEMRHLDWLADAIGELGGDPSMARDRPDFAPDEPVEQMTKNVGLEETAIAQYRTHIEAIDNDHVRQVLARILHDEEAHKGIFEGLVALAGESPADAACANALDTSAADLPSAGPPARIGQILNQGIRHEYTVILQYLYHSFVADDKELMENLQNVAINEMQHMGWLSEEMAEKGGQPDMSHAELSLSRDAAQNLEADIAVEREVTQAYNKQLVEIDDPGLRRVLMRIRDHEIFHDEQFSYLLDEIRASQAAPEEEKAESPKPPEIPTVGSLLGQHD